MVFPGVVEDHGCFLFLRNDATSGLDGFDDKEDAAEMTRVVNVVWERSKQLSSLSLSALTSIGILRIRKERWMARRREFPPIPSLLLPPNNIFYFNFLPIEFHLLAQMLSWPCKADKEELTELTGHEHWYHNSLSMSWLERRTFQGNT